MKKYILIFLLGYALTTSAQPMKTDTFSFVSGDKKFIGLLDQPVEQKPAGLVLLIPGSGKTNMLRNKYYDSLRYFFARAGFACCVWDKSGCGRSEGVFNEGSLQNSAKETLAAIEELKHLNTPGSDKIGLWSLSRGGWVCPLVIESYPAITFWISVSGPDDKDNSAYLLERNFLIEGKSKEETERLVKSWYSNLDIARHGGTYEENQKATEPIRNDSFYIFLTQGSKPSKENYIKWQKSLLNGENMPVDEETGLQVYFPDFDKALSKINCPVLAILGEKDSQVDWRKTITLYKNTIGKNPNTTLLIKTFPDANHALLTCRTGGLREKLERMEFCKGYFETMANWLDGLIRNE